jgi:hypothetical protein
MNNIAICPRIFMYALQNQNVERKVAKKLDISFLSKNDDHDDIKNVLHTLHSENTQAPNISENIVEPPDNTIGETLLDTNYASVSEA